MTWLPFNARDRKLLIRGSIGNGLVLLMLWEAGVPPDEHLVVLVWWDTIYTVASFWRLLFRRDSEPRIEQEPE